MFASFRQLSEAKSSLYFTLNRTGVKMRMRKLTVPFMIMIIINTLLLLLYLHLKDTDHTRTGEEANDFISTEETYCQEERKNATDSTSKLLREHKHVDTSQRIILWYFPPRYIPKDMSCLESLSECPHLNCFMTRDKIFLRESDAVIFSAEHIKGNPPPRKSGQIWIFHNNEPPYLFAYNRPFHKPPWSSAFNWTMDFRHDADIVRPYAKLRKRTQLKVKNYTQIVKKKTKFVAIMVTNCVEWNGRLKYARALNKSIPVDIYGGCGNNSFPVPKHREWLEYLSSNYKFYLAFENSYCMDYISEKFFNNFNLDLVTVGRGGGNYSRDVPQGTYINAEDYKSPQKLAEYLLYLHINMDKYIAILKEKDKYYYKTDKYFYIDLWGRPFLEHYYEKAPLCELCSKLNNIQAYSKTIPNIVSWFNQGVCRGAPR